MSIFSTPQKTKLGSNTFDLTNDFKFSMGMGQLIPINVLETIPGDKFNLKSSLMVRFAPLVAPVMHQAQVKIYHFFVPNRLLWEGWEQFITGQVEVNTGQPIERTAPFFNLGINGNSGDPNSKVEIGDLADYLGIPTEQDVIGSSYPESPGDLVTTPVSALPFAAYWKVIEDYFRDQNLDDGRRPNEQFPLVDGDNSSQYVHYKSLGLKAWQHDYFTSALPWPQKGVEAMLPIGDGTVEMGTSRGNFPKWVAANSATPNNGNMVLDTGTVESSNQTGTKLYYDPEDSLFVKFDEASIVNLRRAIKLQEWLEKNARGGTRYIESVYAHFGVTSSDARLQRAEFIGSATNPVKISEVLQTSGTANDDAGQGEPYTKTPQGNMSGHGISYAGSGNFKYYAEEHGFIISLATVVPRSGYAQGVHRMFKRFDRFDYYWPEFAHIGEQAIEKSEIALECGDAISDQQEVWGYTPRYSEYKTALNRWAGYFRSNLDFWHMGRKFSSAPPLSQNFVYMDQNEVDRIFALDPDQYDYQSLWCMALNEVKANRKMPYFGNPKL